MGTSFGAGFHAAAGRPVDAAAYEAYIGRWSRLFVPGLLAAAEVALSRHLPDERAPLHLSFARADPKRLEDLCAGAGFRDVRVERAVRHGTVASFDEYWAPIEAGTGQMPQAYLALPEASRRAVRGEMRERVAAFASGGRLAMSVEMLIAAGRA